MSLLYPQQSMKIPFDLPGLSHKKRLKKKWWSM